MQYIIICKLILDDVVVFEGVVELSCDVVLELDEEGYFVFSVMGGYFYVLGYFEDYKLVQIFCNLVVIY